MPHKTTQEATAKKEYGANRGFTGKLGTIQA